MPSQSRYDPERHGPERVVGPGFHARVFALVRQVPSGRVTTYGELAAALGNRNVARQVGYAMAAVTDADVPWWRVVAAGGRLTRPAADAARQAERLRAEGIEVLGDRIRDFAQRRFDPSDLRATPTGGGDADAGSGGGSGLCLRSPTAPE